MYQAKVGRKKIASNRETEAADQQQNMARSGSYNLSRLGKPC